MDLHCNKAVTFIFHISKVLPLQHTVRIIFLLVCGIGTKFIEIYGNKRKNKYIK